MIRQMVRKYETKETSCANALHTYTNVKNVQPLLVRYDPGPEMRTHNSKSRRIMTNSFGFSYAKWWKSVCDRRSIEESNRPNA